MKGGVLEFAMTDQPVDDGVYGISGLDGDIDSVAVPVIDGERTFRRQGDGDSLNHHAEREDLLHTTDGRSIPTGRHEGSTHGPFVDRPNVNRQGDAINENGESSFAVEARF